MGTCSMTSTIGWVSELLPPLPQALKAWIDLEAEWYMCQALVSGHVPPHSRASLAKFRSSLCPIDL